MEERIIDKDEERKIRIKRTQDGETDAVDGILPEDAEGAQGTEEYILELPEEDYDEDLVGLTPSQLKAELERREKARLEAIAESKRLTSEANALLKKGDYDEAATFFSQAALYDPENAEAKRGVWQARTQDFSEFENLLSREVAEELDEDEEAKTLLRAKLGAKLKEEHDKLIAEEAELAPRVEGNQSTRRAAFKANRNYYLVRFLVLLCCFAAMVIGAAVSAGFIYRTTEYTPIILTAVFGGLALVFACVGLVYTRKLLVASRLLRDNEKLSSTEEGTRLAYLRQRIAYIKLIVED